MGHEIIVGGNGIFDREFVTKADGTRVELDPADAEYTLVVHRAEDRDTADIQSPQEVVVVDGLRGIAQRVRLLFSHGEGDAS